MSRRSVPSRIETEWVEARQADDQIWIAIPRPWLNRGTTIFLVFLGAVAGFAIRNALTGSPVMVDRLPYTLAFLGFGWVLVFPKPRRIVMDRDWFRLQTRLFVWLKPFL